MKKRCADVFQIYSNAIYSVILCSFVHLCLFLALSRYFYVLVNSMTILSVLKLPKIAWPQLIESHTSWFCTRDGISLILLIFFENYTLEIKSGRLLLYQSGLLPGRWWSLLNELNLSRIIISNVHSCSSCYTVQQTGSVTAYDGPDEEYDVVSTAFDRSFLGDEMASMCAKLPIYRVKKSTTRR